MDDTVVADDVGVRPRGERERQPRHRPRPRQRDAGDRRRRPRRPRLRQVAGPGAPSSATKAATSRSPPTSATCSARSSSRHLGVADAEPIFPGYNVQRGEVPGAVRLNVVEIGDLVNSVTWSQFTNSPTDQISTRCALADLPTPQVLDRSRARCRATSTACRRSPTPRGVRAAAARQDPQVAGRRAAGRSSAARSASAAPRSAKRKCSPTPGIADIRLPYPVNPSNARARAGADGSRGDLDHRRSPGRRARLVRRRCSAPAARSTCWSRWTSASTAAASIRTATRSASSRRSRRAGAAPARPAEPRRPRLSRRVGRRAARRSRGRKPRSLTRLRDRAAASGIALDEISVGATPTLRFSAGQRGLTELRPGNYVYFDRTQVALGAASLDDCALTVLATVVSKPAADRIILDCGSKTLTNDQARGITPAPGYGAVLTGDGDRRAGRRDADDRAAVGGARDGPRRRRHARSSPAIACASCRIIRASCRTWSTWCGSSTATA